MSPASVHSGGDSSSLRDSSISGVDIMRPGQEESMLEERAFSHGAMGVMYTVCKEKVSYSNVFIAFRLLADWLQLWLLVVQPPQFALPPDKRWWQVISFISLNQFMAARGYQFFLACFYLLVVGLILSVGLSVWVGYSFQQNRFDHIWPIIVLRWFAKIFYQILDIMSLSLFLMALDCQTFSRPANRIGYSQEFPDVYCWSMPNLIHVFVAIISLIVFVILAGAFTVGEMELDFTTRNQIAIMHTGQELWAFGIRVLMTFVSVFIYSPMWASVVQLILSCWLTYLIWYWQPQLEGWVNHVRTGMYASVAWCSLLYAISAFNIGWDASDDKASASHIKSLTGMMWGLTIPMACLGALASWARLRYFRTNILPKFRGDIPEDTKDLYEFDDSRFVEVLARCCRVWVKKSVLDPDAVTLGEAVIKVGISQMPKDPFMMILHSSFLMDVQSSYQSGYAQLQAAKKLDTGFLMRFAIFSREQQHAQRSAAGGLGNRAADLVSYVEFQRNYGLVLKVHRDTLTNIQRFWHCLMHRTVRFKTLSDSVQAMDASIRQAERVYKQVLQRHATSVKIVRLYAKFLEHVKQDPWAAARWFSEAERLSVLEEEVKHSDALDGVDIDDPTLKVALLQAGPADIMGAGTDQRAVIIINAQSVIQITNDAVLPLLGYTKSELKGKSLRIILPPTVADYHVTYVRNYIQTGRGVVIDNTTQQVAMHKDKRLLPVKLTVRKISGIGEDTQFMGVLEPIHMSPNEASLWLRPDGNILLACSTFEDWFGFPAKEVQGMNLASLTVAGAKQFEEGLNRARTTLIAEHQQHMIGKVQHDLERRKTLNSHDFKIGAAKGSITFSGQQSLSPLAGDAHVASVLDDTAACPASPSRSCIGNTSMIALSGFDGMVQGVSMAHKFGGPVQVDVQIANAGAGAMRYHVLTIRKAALLCLRPADDVIHTQMALPHAVSVKQFNMLNQATMTDMAQELMLVTNAKGQVCHISSQLALMLGRTRQQAMANNGHHVVEQLMCKPFGHMHRSLMQGVQPTAVAPYGCRSGLSVLMQGNSGQNSTTVIPFGLSISKKVVGDEKYHVATLQERTMQQALDERRLLIQLDEQAVVTQVLSQSPASLFGCDPEKLVGKHAGSFLDVLRSPGAGPNTEMDAVDKQHALEVFLEMASSAVNVSSSCWRVGFIQPEGLHGTESMATAKVMGMLTAKAKPAFMRLKTTMTGSEEFEAGQQVAFELELWRADLCTSVLELDSQGIVLVPELQELPQLYPPDLILGLAPENMLDQHISNLLPPLANRHLSELFVAGAFGPPIAVKGNARRSAMKTGNSMMAGPSQTLIMRHHADEAELQIHVTAIHKMGGMYLVIHPAKPSAGRADFSSWIMNHNRLGYKNSVITPMPPLGMTPALRLSQLRMNLSVPRPHLEQPLPGAVMPATLSQETDIPGEAEAVTYTDTEPKHSLGLDARHLAGVAMIQDVARSSLQRGSNRAGSLKLEFAQPTPPTGPRASPHRHSSLVPDVNGPNPFTKPAWELDEAEGPPEDDDQEQDQSSEQAEDENTAIEIADDAAAQADVMDEGDYKRGQRFKRLYAVLSSITVQKPVDVYRKRAYLLSALVCALQVAAFVAILMLLNTLSTMVKTLTAIGNAGVLAADVALYSRSLNLIYGNITAPNLRMVSGPADLPYLKKVFKEVIEKFRIAHQEVYIGWNTKSPKKMPTAYGLRSLWDDPLLNITEFTDIPYNESLNDFRVWYRYTRNFSSGLWRAGNHMAGKADLLLAEADSFNNSLNGNIDQFANNNNLLWIVTNAKQAIFPSYLATLDGFLQLVVSQAKQVNFAQLILLLIEGLLLCALMSFWGWTTVQDVAKLRFSIYNIFMMVPTSLIKRLATRKFVLGDEEEEDQDENGNDLTKTLPQKQDSNNDKSQGKSMKDDKAQPSKMNIHIRAPPTTQQATADNVWSRTLFRIRSAFGLAASRKDQQDSRRTLVPSYRSSIWLTWPFLVWGLLVILGNSIGYMLLNQVPGPVAMFNAVNYVNLLYNRNNFYLQELVFNPDPNAVTGLRTEAFNRIIEFKKEYELMMYGRQVAAPNDMAPHYRLVTQGVVEASAEGADIMFHTSECLCINQTDCQPPGTPLYEDTRHGLDRILLHYLQIGRSIVGFNYLDPYVNGPEYDFYWNTRPDVKGGLQRVTEVYQKFVITRMRSVLILHVVVFVLTLALLAAFLILMLRPFLKTIDNETRRIAELLSQLPPEVDVSALVAQTLIPQENDALVAVDMTPALGSASNKLSGGGNDEENVGTAPQ